MSNFGGYKFQTTIGGEDVILAYASTTIIAEVSQVITHVTLIFNNAKAAINSPIKSW